MVTTLNKKNAILLITLVALFSSIYNAFLPLHGDEAYYWVWSNNLQSGYYDHPPLIAYFIAFFTYFGDNEFFVRLTNVFCMSVAIFYMYKIALENFNEQIATYSLLLFLSIPLANAGYIITTPDSPLILFWTLSLYFSIKAFQSNKTIYFILAGATLGFAMLSKYTAILLVFSTLIYTLFYRRDLFLNYRYYLSITVAFLVVLPMVFWNYKNDWISFMFQLNHGGLAKTELHYNYILEFFGGHFGVITPVFFTLMLMMIFYKKFYKSEVEVYLLIAFMTTFFFFLYKALYARMELNYDAPAFISASILVSVYMYNKGYKKLFFYGVVTALVLTLLARVGLLFFTIHMQDRMVGYQESVELLAKHREANDALYGNHILSASLLSFYLKDNPETNIANNTRFSQYDMWKKPLKDGLILSYENISYDLMTKYESVKVVDKYELFKGEKLFKTFYIYRVSGAKKEKI